MNRNASSVVQPSENNEVNSKNENILESPASNAAGKTNTSSLEQYMKTGPVFSSSQAALTVESAGTAGTPNTLFPGIICEARRTHANVSNSYTILTDSFDFLEEKIIHDRMVLTNNVRSLELEKAQKELELKEKQENLQALKETGLKAYRAEKSSEGMFDTQESRDKLRDHLNAALLALEEINNLSIEIENDTVMSCGAKGEETLIESLYYRELRTELVDVENVHLNTNMITI